MGQTRYLVFWVESKGYLAQHRSVYILYYWVDCMKWQKMMILIEMSHLSLICLVRNKDVLSLQQWYFGYGDWNRTLLPSWNVIGWEFIACFQAFPFFLKPMYTGDNCIAGQSSSIYCSITQLCPTTLQERGRAVRVERNTALSLFLPTAEVKNLRFWKDSD